MSIEIILDNFLLFIGNLSNISLSLFTTSIEIMGQEISLFTLLGGGLLLGVLLYKFVRWFVWCIYYI